MPDKATIAAPRWVAHGPEPTSKPAKVDLKKSYTNSEPTSIIQHQLTTENGFFLNLISRLSCALLSTAVGLYSRD